MRWEKSFSIAEQAQAQSNPFSGLEIQLVGQWNKFNSLMAYLSQGGGKAIKRDIARGQRKFLERYKSVLITALVTQGASVGAPFAEHSPGYDSPTGSIGIRTGKYLGALRNLKITQKNYVVSLSFSPGDLRQRSFNKGTTLARYAYMFEVGRKGQAARPIWNPTFERIGGRDKALQYMKGSIGTRLDSILR